MKRLLAQQEDERVEQEAARVPAYGRDLEVGFGHTIRRLREARGWTQEDLAQRMAHHGYPMHQVTVGKLENAGRPTSVGELAALGRIFDVDLDAMLHGPEDADAHQRLQKAMDEVRRNYSFMRDLRLRIDDLNRAYREARRDHENAVREYFAARKAAGPGSPRLPRAMETGGRLRGPRKASALFSAGDRVWYSERADSGRGQGHGTVIRGGAKEPGDPVRVLFDDDGEELVVASSLEAIEAPEPEIEAD